MRAPNWFLNIQINGTFIFDETLQAFGIKESAGRDEQGNFQSILTITGNTANNNSELTCIVGQNTTQQIILRVQG